MEAAFAIIPFLFMLVIYFAGLGFVIWFAITLIKSQKERNAILKDISNKLDKIEFKNKEE
ncbi:hypothetical protein [Bacillus dakarensis]|uniref:hypothetical protein n=1 Tax=Robertmurraya dakarensis TaxID=1926278 RepID=UPI00098092D0|nr:hypothetical protein [Bacillus dakarensis]